MNAINNNLYKYCINFIAFIANSGLEWEFNDSIGLFHKSNEKNVSKSLNIRYNTNNKLKKKLTHKRKKNHKWRKSMLAVRMTSRKKSNGTNFKNDVQKKRQTVGSVIDGTKVLSNEKAKLALAGYKINDDGSINASRMTCYGWINFLRQNNLITSNFSVLDAKHIFLQSKMLVCDEIHEYDKSQSLSWCDFLEAICRYAYFLETNNDNHSKKSTNCNNDAIDSFQKLMVNIEQSIRDHNYEEMQLKTLKNYSRKMNHKESNW